MNLTIEQRDRLRAILPQYEQKSTGRKRADTVQVFEGILWLLTVAYKRLFADNFTGLSNCRNHSKMAR